MGALSIGLGGTGRHSLVDFPLRGVDRTAVDGPWSGPAFPWAPLPPALGSSDGRSAGGSVWCLRAEGVVFPGPPDGARSYPTGFPRGHSSVEPLQTRCPFRLPFPGRSVGLVPRRFGRGFVGRTGPAVRWRPLLSGVGSVHRSLHPCLALSDTAGTWRLSCGLSLRAWLYLTLRGRGVCPVACHSGRGSIGCLRGLVCSAAAGWLALGPPGLGGRGARRGCRGGRSVRCTTRATDSVPAGLASGAWSVQRAPPHGPFLGGVLCLARSHGRRI